MKTLKQCGDNYGDFLANSDDTWVFTKGACHAFALELFTEFRKRGINADLYYVSSEHEEVANHVVVKVGECYRDVCGKATEAEIVEKWGAGESSRLLPVGHEGWISMPGKNRDSVTSYLGLFVAADFISRARERARAWISVRSDIFT